MTHLCPARRCPRTVPDHLLMCGIHWRLVPPLFQHAVWTAYDHGRGLGTDQLLIAQADAIAACNARLGYRGFRGGLTDA